MQVCVSLCVCVLCDVWYIRMYVWDGDVQVCVGMYNDVWFLSADVDLNLEVSQVMMFGFLALM